MPMSRFKYLTVGLLCKAADPGLNPWARKVHFARLRERGNANQSALLFPKSSPTKVGRMHFLVLPFMAGSRGLLLIVASLLLPSAVPVSAGPRVHTSAGRHTSIVKHVSPKPYAPAASDLFVRILRSDDTYSYKGRQVTTYWAKGRTTDVLVFHETPDFRRIYYLNPESQHGRLLVSDGKQQWQFDPRRRQLLHRLLSPGALDEDDFLSYTLLRANYLLSVDPQPRMVAERKAWVVTIKRPNGLPLARRLWIDAGSGLILKREIYREDGKLAVTVAFTEITYHLKLDPAIFNLSPLAKSVHLTETRSSAEAIVALPAVSAQLAGQVYAPPVLAGYRLVGATTTSVGGKPLLHLRYSDGLNLISLFEQRRTQSKRPTLVPVGMHLTQIGGFNVHVAHHTSLTTLNWDTAALNVTLMGEMGLNALRPLAEEAVKGR